MQKVRGSSPLISTIVLCVEHDDGFSFFLAFIMIFRSLSILIGIAALTTAFFSLFWSWVIITVPVIYLAFLLWSAKRHAWKEIPSLSPPANTMLRKFGHFYAMPFAATDFSASATVFQLCGIAIGLIGVFQGFYWGLGLSLVVAIFMANVARLFNPTNFLQDEEERASHREILNYLNTRQKERRKNR